MKKINIIIVLAILMLPTTTLGISTRVPGNKHADFDPLVDLSVSLEIQAIRYLAIDDLQTFPKNKGNNTPSLYLTVFINNQEFTSPVWENMKYIYNPGWTATLNVPDDVENVTITLQLWSNETEAVPYDLSPDLDDTDVTITYSIKTGHWTGDDSIGDASGYGRLCGCDDGTIYGPDRDCELWFSITQNDFDNDHIPYWIEVNTLGTDPEVDDTTSDPDTDDIPTYWEYHWGYPPLTANDFENIDPDGDSINNIEEYLTSEWFSDPYRKDIFVEMDIMGEGPNGEKTYFPENSKELIMTALDKQNIIYHLDMGDMGGYEVIPFADDLSRDDLVQIYNTYFLHGNQNNWRRGVFHYGLVVYDAGITGYTYLSNAYQITSSHLEEKTKKLFLKEDIIYASGYLHELGHTLAFWQIPGHSRLSAYPWQIGWWWAHSYRSCMNYGWTYLIVDYSDGSRRTPDLNDWERIDYSAFEDDWW
ncbi:MAG: hypothetical protein MUC80_03335 [Candidatus Thermoplasmatota archaeon]|jgi:hypothetical protein|nr:hypothetical protein [Candidatus Thermoplasmatota archaeon]